jgi:hypothetical protein
MFALLEVMLTVSAEVIEKKRRKKSPDKRNTNNFVFMVPRHLIVNAQVAS